MHYFCQLFNVRYSCVVLYVLIYIFVLYNYVSDSTEYSGRRYPSRSEKSLRSLAELHDFPSLNSPAPLPQSDKPQSCFICGQTFPSTQQLGRHMSALHAGSAPFKCTLCPKAYFSQSGLARHMHTHKGRTHLCHICDKTFTQTTSLTRHMTQVHNVVKDETG